MIEKGYFEIGCSYSFNKNPVINGTGFPVLDKLENYLSKQYEDKYINLGEFRHLNSMFCSFGFDRKNITISYNIDKSIFKKYSKRIFEYIKHYFYINNIEYIETDSLFIINKKSLDKKFPEYKDVFFNKILKYLKGLDLSKRSKISIYFQDAIDSNGVVKYSKKMFKEIIYLIKTENSLSNYAKQFQSFIEIFNLKKREIENKKNQDDKLGKEIKEFAETILKKYLNLKKYGLKVDFKFVSFKKELPGMEKCLGFACIKEKEYDDKGYSFNKDTEKKEGEIWLNSDHKFTLSEFLGTLAHEINHILDHNGLGFLNEQQIQIFELTGGHYTTIDDMFKENYRKNLSEQVSLRISSIFEIRKKLY